MHVLAEREVDEMWRETLAAGVLQRSPFFLDLVIWLINSCIGVAIVVSSAYRNPGIRRELLILLGFLAILWIATGYLMLKLWRYTSSELEKQDNPALLHASYLGFRLYQMFLATCFIVCLMVAILTPMLRR